jgi:hypothetical protein
MEIFVSDTEYNLSIKGRGTIGVGLSDGQHTVVLARLGSGGLGWLCDGCDGEGLVVGDRFEKTRRPRCRRCSGTGIKREYADVEAATVAVRRHLEGRYLSKQDLAALRAAQHQEWTAANTGLLEQVRQAAPHAPILRDLLRVANRGLLWTPRQEAAARALLTQIADPAPTRFFGAVGEAVEFTGVIANTGVSTKYGPLPLTMHTATITGQDDAAGAVFRMVGTTLALKRIRGLDGDRIRMSGVVKGHVEYLGERRTQISRGKLLELTEQDTPEMRAWPGEVRITTRAGVVRTRRVRDGRQAHNLLGAAFVDLRDGAVTSAEVAFGGREPVVLTADDVLGDDPYGRYAALLGD